MRTETLARRFSVQRFLYLLRNRFLDELPVLLVGLGAVAALNALGLAFGRQAWFNHGQGQVWSIIVFLGGLLLAAQAFKGMHDGKAGTDWLLLPATPLEKFSAAALDYLVLYPVVASTVIMGLSALLDLLERALGGSGGIVWMPFQEGVIEAFLQYLVLASVFLAGSASLRKAVFLKTIAIAMAYGLAMVLLSMAAAWLVSRGHGFDSSHFSFNNGNFDFDGTALPERAQQAIIWTYRTAWNVLLPLFALVFGFFRVVEKEARDEVQ